MTVLLFPPLDRHVFKFMFLCLFKLLRKILTVSHADNLSSYLLFKIDGIDLDLDNLDLDPTPAFKICGFYIKAIFQGRHNKKIKILSFVMT